MYYFCNGVFSRALIPILNESPIMFDVYSERYASRVSQVRVNLPFNTCFGVFSKSKIMRIFDKFDCRKFILHQ